MKKPRPFKFVLGDFSIKPENKIGSMFIDSAGNRYKYVGIKYGPKLPLLYAWLPCKFELNMVMLTVDK
jgi:hypothetical protein